MANRGFFFWRIAVHSTAARLVNNFSFFLPSTRRAGSVNGRRAEKTPVIQFGMLNIYGNYTDGANGETGILYDPKDENDETLTAVWLTFLEVYGVFCALFSRATLAIFHANLFFKWISEIGSGFFLNYLPKVWLSVVFHFLLDAVIQLNLWIW